MVTCRDCAIPYEMWLGACGNCGSPEPAAAPVTAVSPVPVEPPSGVGGVGGPAVEGSAGPPIPEPAPRKAVKKTARRAG